jgi:hypothetical protein
MSWRAMGRLLLRRRLGGCDEIDFLMFSLILFFLFVLQIP